MIPSVRHIITRRHIIIICSRAAALSLCIYSILQLVNHGLIPALFASPRFAGVLRISNTITPRIALLNGLLFAAPWAAVAVLLIFLESRIARWVVPWPSARCPRCDYDVSRSSSSTCPECGLQIPAQLHSRSSDASDPPAS